MNASTFDTLSVARDLEAAGIERRHAEALRQAVSAGQHVSTDNASCTTITAIRISTAAPPLDSRPELARESTHRTHQRGDLAAPLDRLARASAMTPSVAVADRRTTPPRAAVHSAPSPASHRRASHGVPRRVRAPHRGAACMGLIVAFGVIPPPPLP